MNIGGMLGLSGGAAGSGFNAPQQADIINPTSLQQTQDAYKQSQDAIAQQQAFAQAVNPGGTAALGSQQALLGQLGQAAQGQGPNPALAQLAQSTQANVANQAALAAGQRGSSQNTGMIARQAMQQGAGTQQQAAGQAATLAAQQQIQARQQLQQQQAQMVGQQQQGLGQLNQVAQGEQGQLLGAIQGVNNARVGSQSSVNAGNTSLANTSMQGQQNMLGNITGGLGTATNLIGKGVRALGGLVGSAGSGIGAMAGGAGDAIGGGEALGEAAPLMLAAEGGKIPQSQPAQPMAASTGPRSMMGRFMAGNLQSQPGQLPPLTGMINPSENATASSEHTTNLAYGGNYAQGGEVKAMVSPGEQYLAPADVAKVKQGKNPLAVGERIPGTPKYAGNNYANDTVPKNLEAGGVVIPNSIMQGKNPAWNAMRFVHAHMAKGGKVMPRKKK